MARRKASEVAEALGKTVVTEIAEAGTWYPAEGTTPKVRRLHEDVGWMGLGGGAWRGVAWRGVGGWCRVSTTPFPTKPCLSHRPFLPPRVRRLLRHTDYHQQVIPRADTLVIPLSFTHHLPTPACHPQHPNTQTPPTPNHPTVPSQYLEKGGQCARKGDTTSIKCYG